MSVALFDCLLFLTNEFFLLEFLLLERCVRFDCSSCKVEWLKTSYLSWVMVHIFLGLWCNRSVMVQGQHCTVLVMQVSCVQHWLNQEQPNCNEVYSVVVQTCADSWPWLEGMPRAVIRMHVMNDAQWSRACRLVQCRKVCEGYDCELVRLGLMEPWWSLQQQLEHEQCCCKTYQL